MKFEHTMSEDGFYLKVVDTGSRTRMLSWKAASEGGETILGALDLGFLASGDTAYVQTGFTPISVSYDQIRDQTPGVHQPVMSQIPAGSCLLCFDAETAIPGRIDVQVSPTGNPNDSRSVGQLPISPVGGKVELAIVSRDTWCKLFVKKGDDFAHDVVLSNFCIVFPNKQVFESLNHLVKPEHESLAKEGDRTVRFSAKSSRYSYFSIGFQKR